MRGHGAAGMGGEEGRAVCPRSPIAPVAADTFQPRNAPLELSFRSPLKDAKVLRRKAHAILLSLDPVEAQRRSALEDEESLTRYQLETSQYRSTLACVRVYHAEEASRCLHQFTERTERRNMRRRLDALKHCATIGQQWSPTEQTPSSVVHCMEGLSPCSPAASTGMSAPLSPLSPASSTSPTRRRTIVATQSLSSAEKYFLALMDALETGEQKGRSWVQELQLAARHQLSQHAFFDEYYEFAYHVFDNVPRVPQDEASRRARAMVMLWEWKARMAISADWLERHTDICKILSPFTPASVHRLEWQELEKQYFNHHFNFLDGAWSMEELHAREGIKARFEEGTLRVLATVHAYVVLQEPAQRRVIRRTERNHWSSLVAHEHPRMIQIRRAHMRALMRRCLRRFLNLRSFRLATVQQTERVLVMASLCLEGVRHRYFADWRRVVLWRRQHVTIATMARLGTIALGSRYLQHWTTVAARHVRHTGAVTKLLKQTAAHEQRRYAAYFTAWGRYRLYAMSARLQEANQRHALRLAATRWYWGAWMMRRRKQYRTKYFKLERMAQLWRLSRTMETWGRDGFLMLQKAKREKHEELTAMAVKNARRTMALRWQAWRRFAKRKKQKRIAIKLERLNMNYTKVRRFVTWLALIGHRHGVRHVNALLTRFVPEWTAPWWALWRRAAGRHKRLAADKLCQENQARVVGATVQGWRVWAHRHRYRRLVVNEGQLDFLQCRNQFRYAVARLRGWVGHVQHRKQVRQTELLQRKNDQVHQRHIFDAWQWFRIRHPQWIGLERLRRHATACTTRAYYSRWMRYTLQKDLRQDKHMLAASLERRNVRLFASSVMRRFNTRAAQGRVAILTARANDSLLRKGWVTLAHHRRFQREMAVARNLCSVNEERWRLCVWKRWQSNAFHRRRITRAKTLERTNAMRCLRLAWHRTFAMLLDRVALLRGLQSIRLLAEARLMVKTFSEWVHYARTWKREMLARTLFLKNTERHRRACFLAFAHYRLHGKARRVAALSFAMPGAAGRRYYARWLRAFRRCVHHKVAETTLGMLYAFWTQRRVWAHWSHRVFARQAAITATEHATAEGDAAGTSNLPPPVADTAPNQGHRALLRSLRDVSRRVEQQGGGGGVWGSVPDGT